MNKYVNWLRIAPVLCLLFGTFVAQAQESEEQSEPYRLQPGDVLLISVWKEPELQRNVLVRPDGGISFPLAGDIMASGRSVPEVQEELSSRMSRYISEVVVTVSLEEVRGNKVFVLGQVNNPGEFVVNPSVDVIQALSMAQGTTPFAQVDDIVILRRTQNGQEALEFSFSDVINGRRLEQNITLESGDVVIVP